MGNKLAHFPCLVAMYFILGVKDTFLLESKTTGIFKQMNRGQNLSNQVL